MKSLAFSACAATLGLIAGLAPAAFAGAQETDPLACARTSEGVGIRMGTEVLDENGKRIGAVSQSQCTPAAESGKLRVFMDASLGGEVKVFDLEGVTATAGAVRLPVTSEEIAEAPEKTPPGA